MSVSPAELFRLDGRVALVTGASRGIGLSCAAVLASAGAHVVMVARDAANLEAARDGIAAQGGSAEAVTFDVTDEAAIRDAVAALDARGRSPNILVNNAGRIDRASLADSTTEDWRGVVETNLTGPYVLARTVSGAMQRRKWGRIVNIASILAMHGKPNAHSYTATKHAISGLTRSLCAELGKDGVLVNAICPGYIRTEFNKVLQEDPAFSDMVLSRVPLRRWGEPADLAGPLLLLASNASSYVNGHLFVVDGGLTATH